MATVGVRGRDWAGGWALLRLSPRPRWLLRLAPAVVPVVLFGPNLLRGSMIGRGDATDYYLPLYTLVARAWAAGQIPGWNPFSFSGSPLLAAGPAAAFYPPHVLYLVASKPVVYDVLIIAHFVVAGLGAAALARRLTRDEVAGAVAGVGFGLCGYLLGHVVHAGSVECAAWVPWTFLAYERLRERMSAGNLALGAVALALMTLPGEFQVLGMALMALFVYALALTVLEWRRGRVRPLLTAGALVAAGLGLAAIQLVPTAAILAHTPRGNYSFHEAIKYSFGWLDSPLLLFPYLYGLPGTVRGVNFEELSGYPGLALLVLAAAALGAARRDRRVWGVLAMGVVALVAALGDATPAAHLLYALPVYGEFQSWGRYAMVVDLSVALLAAYGVSRLRDARHEVRRAAFRAALAMAAVVALAALVVPRLGPVAAKVSSGAAGAWVLLVPAGAAVAAALVALAHRRFGATGALTALLLVLVALDPVLSYGGFEWQSSPSFAKVARQSSPATVPEFGPVHHAPGGIDRYVLVTKDPSKFVHLTDVKGIRTINGYETLAPADYLRRVGAMDTRRFAFKRPALVFSPRSHVLDLLRVTTITTKFGTRPRRARLPDAFVVGQASLTSPRRVLDSLYGRVAFDPARQALFEHPCGRPCATLRAPGLAGTVRAERWDGDGVHLDVDARRPGLLNVSQAWFPGWHATVGGRDAPVLRSDGLLTAVPVGAGDQRVVLSYRPPGLVLGALITLVTALGLLGAALWRRAASPIPWAAGAPATRRPAGRPTRSPGRRWRA